MPGGSNLFPHLSLSPSALDSASPDEGDSESVCSSQDGSVMSEEGACAVAGPPGGEVREETEEDLQFVLSERIDQLGDKRWKRKGKRGGLSLAQGGSLFEKT